MKTVIFCLLASVGIASAQNDIVVDNPQAAFEGEWNLAKSSKDKYGEDYRAIGCVYGDPTGTATFRPEIGLSGKYNVEIAYPRGENRSKISPWTISCKSGVFITNIDESVDGGTWIRIGTALEFEAGTAGFVQLANNTGEDKETSAGRPVVIADAVRFVRAGKGDVTTRLTTAATTPAPSHSSPPKKQQVSDKPSSAKPISGWRFSLQKSSRGNGKVLVSPDQPGYMPHDMVELTAQPDKGDVFVGWSGDFTGMDNPLKFAVSNNVSVTAEFLPEAAGAIVESLDAESRGHWTTNSQKWTGQRSDSYLFSAASMDPESYVLFRPKLPKTGKYDIYIYYLQGDNRATKTEWEISCKEGTSTVLVDQRQNGRAWFPVASGKVFEAGTKGYVKITSRAEPIPSVVVADSVAFVYAGPVDEKFVKSLP